MRARQRKRSRKRREGVGSGVGSEERRRKGVGSGVFIFLLLPYVAAGRYAGEQGTLLPLCLSVSMFVCVSVCQCAAYNFFLCTWNLIVISPRHNHLIVKGDCHAVWARYESRKKAKLPKKRKIWAKTRFSLLHIKIMRRLVLQSMQVFSFILRLIKLRTYLNWTRTF